MPDKSKQLLSAAQAAQWIYNTPSPNSSQVEKVRGLLRSGRLKSRENRPLVTTRGAVAEYLATKELRQQESNRAELQADTLAIQSLHESEPAPRQPRLRRLSDRKLRRVYYTVLNDYFLSLISYKRLEDRTDRFQAIVLVSQFVLLAGLLGGGAWVAHSIVSGGRQPEAPWLKEGNLRVQSNRSPEKATIQGWIGANRPAGELLDILPAHSRPGGTAVRARLRFQMPDKPSQMEDSVFVINGGEVIRTETPDTMDQSLAVE